MLADSWLRGTVLCVTPRFYRDSLTAPGGRPSFHDLLPSPRPYLETCVDNDIRHLQLSRVFTGALITAICCGSQTP